MSYFACKVSRTHSPLPLFGHISGNHNCSDTIRQTNDINKSMLNSKKYKIQLVLASRKRSLVGKVGAIQIGVRCPQKTGGDLLGITW